MSQNISIRVFIIYVSFADPYNTWEISVILLLISYCAAKSSVLAI